MRILSILFSDWKIKIVAILIALSLWFHSITQREYTAIRNVEIVYTGVPDSLTFRTLPPSKIQASFTAPGKTLIKLSLFKPQILLDLSKIEEGEVEIPLSKKNLLLLEKEEIREILLPEKSILLTIDRIREKKVDVDIVLTGTPRRGYTIRTAKLENTEVFIRGPESLVNKIKSVKTQGISLTGKKGSFYEITGLLSPSELVYLYPDSVKVFIQIEEEEIKKLTDVEYTMIVPREYNADARPEVINIVVKGGKSHIEPMNASDVRIILNLVGMGPGEYLISPNVILPDSIYLVSTEPEYITVEIEKKIEGLP